MVDHSREGGGKVMRGDVGCWKVMWVVGWYMCSVDGGGYVVGDLGGGEGSSRGWGCSMPWVSGWELSGMGIRNGCLLGGGEGVKGGVVFALLFCGLEGRGPCSFRRLLSLSLQGGISLDLLPKARVFLSQR